MIMNILTYQTIVPEVEILEKGLRINSEKYIERLTACRDVYDREGIHPKTTIDFDSFFKNSYSAFVIYLFLYFLSNSACT